MNRHRRSTIFLGAVLVLGWILVACSDRDSSQSSAVGSRTKEALSGGAGFSDALDSSEPFFVEVGAELGVDFVHDPGFEGEYRMPEILGAGGALFDVDGDGRLDLYLVNGGSLRESEWSAGNRLYLQTAEGLFIDATESSGTGDRGYGMGTAIGDVDNDGDLDLYVTNLGPDVFYRNEGSGRFLEQTSSSGLDNDGWSTSAAFFDADGDGWLDLYVTRYVAYEGSQECRNMAGQKEYCGPISFRGLRDLFYLNQKGTFVDRSSEVGISFVAGRGLGVLPADFDGDGWTDLYVANDGEANFLWANRGDGSFEDLAVMMGVAVNSQGRTEASMGLALGDVEGDGDLDLFVTHLMEETNTLYLDHGGAAFEDRVAASGLGGVSLPTTGFGTAFFDAELDGDLDLLVANGKVRLSLEAPSASVVEEGAKDGLGLEAYAEQDLFFIGDGAGKFEAARDRGGDLIARKDISRAALVGDLDADGDLDLVVTTTGGSPRIYRNEAPRQGQGVKIRAFLPTLNRDAVGAVVTVNVAGRRWVQSVSHCQSYLGSGTAELFFGLGEARQIDLIDVLWPGGQRETFGPFPVGPLIQVQAGGGAS